MFSLKNERKNRLWRLDINNLRIRLKIKIRIKIKGKPFRSLEILLNQKTINFRILLITSDGKIMNFYWNIKFMNQAYLTNNYLNFFPRKKHWYHLWWTRSRISKALCPGELRVSAIPKLPLKIIHLINLQIQGLNKKVSRVKRQFFW